MKPLSALIMAPQFPGGSTGTRAELLGVEHREHRLHPLGQDQGREGRAGRSRQLGQGKDMGAHTELGFLGRMQRDGETVGEISQPSGQPPCLPVRDSPVSAA